jgi:hypothetical protein
MGASLSWLAVSGRDPEAVLAALSLERSGETSENPASAIACAALPDGWLLLWLGEFDSPHLAPERLEALSDGCRVVACQVEEHVMYSFASLHADGHEVWRVAHDAQEDAYHLDARGDLPAGFAGLLARHEAEQDAEGGEGAEVDVIFNVPLALAGSMTGYRHDEWPAGAALDFAILTPARGSRPGAIAPATNQPPGSAAERPWWRFW